MAQALTGIGQAIFSPLALQFGLIDPEKFYNWSKDYIQASQLDPARYINRPPGVSDAPKITADEAILALTEGRLPTDTQPLEPAQEHLNRLTQFMQSDEYGYMAGGKELLFREYLNYIVGFVRQQMQQQQMAAAAAQFSQMMGQGNAGGAGAGRPPETAPDTSMQTQMPGMDEIAGAELASAQ